MLAILLLAATNVRAVDDADSCARAEADLKAKVEAIKSRYKAKLEGKEAEYRRAADNIQHDATESTPTAFGAVTKFDINVDWKDTSIVFDLPSVVLNQMTIIMGLPQVAINQQKWVYDLPATRMENQKVGQHPEVTCHPFPACDWSMKDNIISVPAFYMERHETNLGVPEFAIRDQKMIFGIPAITMERQEIIMGLPWITVTNVEAQVAAVQSEAAEFQQKAETDSAQLAAEMKAEIASTASTALRRVFACERNRLATNRSQSLSKIDAELSKAKAAAQAARDAHADAASKTADAVVSQIVATRAAVNAQFDEAAAKLEESARTALDSFGVTPGTRK